MSTLELSLERPQARLLLIDDQVSFSRALAYLLRQLHYHITSATTARAGLLHGRRHRVDLALVNVELDANGLDGPALIRHLLALQPSPIVIGLSGGPSRQGALPWATRHQLGIRHLFRKPFNTEDLLSVLAAELSGVSQRRAEVPAGSWRLAVATP